MQMYSYIYVDILNIRLSIEKLCLKKKKYRVSVAVVFVLEQAAVLRDRIAAVYANKSAEFVQSLPGKRRTGLEA